MTAWGLWRQDDNGNRVRMGLFADRVEAVAKILALESGLRHKQTYWLDGPPGPVCRTNRDLYHRLVEAGERMNAAGRGLDVFLRSWWLVCRPLSRLTSLDLDTVAATIAAAGMVEPPSTRASWRSASFRCRDDPTSYADWEAVVLSQIADLADFADHGTLDGYAGLGADVPRPAGAERATGIRWYNFDPAAYLGGGMAGALGGWGEGGGQHEPVPGPVGPIAHEAEPAERAIDALGWGDLATLARCGQGYE